MKGRFLCLQYLSSVKFKTDDDPKRQSRQLVYMLSIRFSLKFEVYIINADNDNEDLIIDTHFCRYQVLSGAWTTTRIHIRILQKSVESVSWRKYNYDNLKSRQESRGKGKKKNKKGAKRKEPADLFPLHKFSKCEKPEQKDVDDIEGTKRRCKQNRSGKSWTLIRPSHTS